jgi:hypothetical protein
MMGLQPRILAQDPTMSGGSRTDRSDAQPPYLPNTMTAKEGYHRIKNVNLSTDPSSLDAPTHAPRPTHPQTPDPNIFKIQKPKPKLNQDYVLTSRKPKIMTKSQSTGSKIDVWKKNYTKNDSSEKLGNAQSYQFCDAFNSKIGGIKEVGKLGLEDRGMNQDQYLQRRTLEYFKRKDGDECSKAERGKFANFVVDPYWDLWLIERGANPELTTPGQVADKIGGNVLKCMEQEKIREIYDAFKFEELLMRQERAKVFRTTNMTQDDVDNPDSYRDDITKNPCFQTEFSLISRDLKEIVKKCVSSNYINSNFNKELNNTLKKARRKFAHNIYHPYMISSSVKDQVREFITKFHQQYLSSKEHERHHFRKNARRTVESTKTQFNYDYSKASGRRKFNFAVVETKAIELFFITHNSLMKEFYLQEQINRIDHNRVLHSFKRSLTKQVKDDMALIIKQYAPLLD